METPYMAPITSQCPQCKLIHPILKEGEKCPMAKEFTNNGQEIDVNSFLSKLKDIYISNIKIKKIQNIKTFTSSLLIEITKYCENYKEGL